MCHIYLNTVKSANCATFSGSVPHNLCTSRPQHTNYFCSCTPRHVFFYEVVLLPHTACPAPTNALLKGQLPLLFRVFLSSIQELLFLQAEQLLREGHSDSFYFLTERRRRCFSLCCRCRFALRQAGTALSAPSSLFGPAKHAQKTFTRSRGASLPGGRRSREFLRECTFVAREQEECGKDARHHDHCTLSGKDAAGQFLTTSCEVPRR